MKFCEKCISYDMCNYEYEHQDTDAILTFFPNNTDCPWFKNKSDFVKVVRCEDCVMHEEGCPLDTHPYMTPNDGYCYKGKRRDT